MRDYRISIKDILDAMEKIDQFTHGMSYDEFCQDEKTISAVRDKLIWHLHSLRRMGLFAI